MNESTQKQMNVHQPWNTDLPWSVYVAEIGELHKVGITMHAKRRISCMGGVLITECKCPHRHMAYIVEAGLRMRLERWRVMGREWYLLPDYVLRALRGEASMTQTVATYPKGWDTRQRQLLSLAPVQVVKRDPTMDAKLQEVLAFIKADYECQHDMGDIEMYDGMLVCARCKGSKCRTKFKNPEKMHAIVMKPILALQAERGLARLRHATEAHQ